MGTPRRRLTDQGSIAESAFPCPVIQTDDVRLWVSRPFRLVDEAQDGIATPADAKYRFLHLLPLGPNHESQVAERFVAAVWCGSA
jgi:hypothetical protein